MEKKLKKLGFKKKWLSDKSGFWFEKNFKYKDLRLQLMADLDNKHICLGIRVDPNGTIKIKLSSCYDFVYQKKLTIKNVKLLIKRYK